MQSNNSQQKPYVLLAHAGGNLFAFTITSSPWLPLCPLSYELKCLFCEHGTITGLIQPGLPRYGA